MQPTTFRHLMITACLAGSLAWAGACSQGDPGPDATPPTVSVHEELSHAGPPSAAEVRSATFHGLLTDPVPLTDGRWEGEPTPPDAAIRPRVALVEDFEIRGDLDGDGTDEAVVLLAVNTGGSGEFIHLATVARQAGEIVNTATTEVGDRVKLRSGAIMDAKIVLDVVQHGAADPSCCPGDMATRTWILDGDGLHEIATEITGRFSVASLAGTAWVLEKLTAAEPAPEFPTITLFFEDGQAVGSSGCNRYFGRAKDGKAPGRLEVGPFGATRMACPDPMMELERRYMQQLGSATGFTFLGGKLSVAWKSGESTEIMVFGGHEIAEE